MFWASSSAKIPTPPCNDYAAFVAAYAELCRDAPHQKVLDNDVQSILAEETQRELQGQRQKSESRPSCFPSAPSSLSSTSALVMHRDKGQPNSNPLTKRKQAADGILVEETQREMQGQNQKSKVTFSSNLSSFPSASPSLSSISNLVTKNSKATSQAASATTRAQSNDSRAFGSSQSFASASSFTSLSSWQRQDEEEEAAVHPLRSAISLTSLLGGNSFGDSAAISSASNFETASSDTETSSSSSSSLSLTKSTKEAGTRNDDLSKSIASWYPTTMTLSMYALRNLQV